MKKGKKLFSVFLVVLLMSFLVLGCGGGGSSNGNTPKIDSITPICKIRIQVEDFIEIRGIFRRHLPFGERITNDTALATIAKYIDVRCEQFVSQNDGDPKALIDILNAYVIAVTYGADLVPQDAPDGVVVKIDHSEMLITISLYDYFCFEDPSALTDLGVKNWDLNLNIEFEDLKCIAEERGLEALGSAWCDILGEPCGPNLPDIIELSPQIFTP